MDPGTKITGVFGMKVTCPNCQTKYQVLDEKIPAKGARATCANCGQIIIIPGTGDKSSSELISGTSKVDYGQTMAYDFSEVDQSKTEISAFLNKMSDREPFVGKGMAPVLVEVRTGKEHVLPGPRVTVGRRDTDITVDDPEVSRSHCVIKVFGDRIVILDLQSTNGTFVGGKKVMTATIGVSEQFSIGSTTLELVDKNKV
ncbi:MAG: FHA domain-containing protein [Pseudomonadota bacterium]|jgi:predicted Zn finger-like uncharacterized protein